VEVQQPSRARIGRLIAVCRVVLALFAVVAVWIDPDMAGLTETARLSVLPVVVYAVALLGLAWRSTAPTLRFRVVIHCADFGLYTWMVFITRGASSPFFVFFLFLLFCAMLRFGTRAVILTGLAAAVLYVGLAISQNSIRSDPGYLLLRISSLGVVTTLIAYISAHQERSTRDLQQLANWPAMASAGDESVREALTRAAALLRAPRAAAVWEAGEEPWVHVALLEGETFTLRNEGPEAAEALVTPELRDTAFFTAQDDEIVAMDEAGAMRRWRGDPLGETGRRRFAPAAIVSAPLAGDVLRGRFFAFDSAGGATLDDLVLARVAAGLIAAWLAQTHFIARLRDAAVADERVRLARNLHDWLLQSLTAASLQIEIARRALGATHPADARLVKIQDLLEADQRELRTFISQMRTKETAPPALHRRLSALAERFANQWHVDVDVRLTPAEPILAEGLAGEIYSLISEAVANAARHAGAQRIVARAEIDSDEVLMSIDDDGRGFPFHGIYTLAELDAQKRGPVTLKERVASLGGSLMLYSTGQGARLEIRIPR